MRIRKLYNGGNPTGDPKKPSKSVGTSVASPAAAPNYLINQNFKEVQRIVDALEAGEDVMYDPKIAPAIAEERMFREKQKLTTPMATEPGFYEGYMVDDSGRVLYTGAAKPQSPVAEFLTPVGDVMAIGEGARMLAQGIREKDLGKTGLGAGLSLGAVGMAFLPGNANMIRTYGEAVDSKVIDDISNIIDQSRLSGSDINLNDVMTPVFSRYGRAEREEASDHIASLLDMTEDPYSGFELTSEEKKNLTDIMFSLSSEGPPPPLSASPLMRFEESDLDSNLPEIIGDFKKRESNEGGKRVIAYENENTGDYIDLTTLSLESEAPYSWVQAYPESYINKMNVDMTGGKLSGEMASRDVYSMMSKMMDQVKSGDLVSPGSLSTDSYPIYIRQLDKGKKYLTEGGKKQGTKIADKVPESEAIIFSSLNSMGKFTNFFKIPDEFISRVSTDGLLTHYGTSRVHIGEDGFSSVDEANKFLMEIKKKYIDPQLEKRGLPPTEVRPHYGAKFALPGDAKPIYLEFPTPIVEKLIMGGKVGLIKKAKKGMRVKKFS